jgi:hypothetical protein
VAGVIGSRQPDGPGPEDRDIDDVAGRHVLKSSAGACLRAAT